MAAAKGPKAPSFDAKGARKEVTLPEKVFGAEVNQVVMHSVVRSQLAAARAGTHSTKTRAEVRGGGAKPWRQKGTGRARHGSIREPQWAGGGVAHGPKPRDYSQRINKKVKAKALHSALSVRVQEGALRVVDFPKFDRPETKKAVDLLNTWEATGRVLLVTGTEDLLPEEIYKSFRNLPEVMSVRYPTVSSVLAADTVLLTSSALKTLSGGEG
ncbi:MAG: 50S ribosomal protein L4 [Actinomycetota bacterium]